MPIGAAGLRLKVKLPEALNRVTVTVPVVKDAELSVTLFAPAKLHVPPEAASVVVGLDPLVPERVSVIVVCVVLDE